MEPLTWTGSLSGLNIIFLVVLGLLALSIVLSLLASLVPVSGSRAVSSDGTLAADQGATGFISMITGYLFYALIALVLVYLVGGILMGTGAGIFGGMARQFLPVWISLIVIFAASITYKRKLGLYGKLFDSTVGMIGFAIVLFWVLTGVFGGVFDMLVTHDSLSQVSGMKNKLPGTPLRGADEGDYQWFLLGGDNLARDVFSRLIKGSWVVVQIAPLATLFAFMVGITLGLPAGYYGGRLDTVLSFLANLILAFPVILLFYLLVTPEIVLTGIPNYMALFLFVFPLIFVAILLNSRFYTQPSLRTPLLIVVLGILGWLYLSLVSTNGAIVETDTYRLPGLPAFLDGFDIDAGVLVVFVSVVFVNSPTVFRIVRGLALDIKTRDYVAAAQTRGEGPWYIMLWEILPNARGPLIVDFCLRIGYTTILLGTLGFFGLGLESESPDWGSTINAGRRLLSLYPHAAIAPALALLSLVLGLNLLADGLREESLRD
ncbi:Oligopeptide ABC transporter, permease protein [Sulfitobacter noctilucicola]|uniref:Peptide/nickel transport system permease protein n=1 Tax=Sulfitobacter noctilucicola TaxID=1342301 RepID=A0A7W6M750_9RHOB|nr:ABC transporter permease [Sulfitobacter noctilucicola]KIN65207.1 Oligopeptide ABC transporter, permease protein [Sulfitobacter noctilucicola]MBB4173659.1 peptide/nickel transport system permease protein [Sulfitobacter noctilucicola]